MSALDLAQVNAQFSNDAQGLVEWALGLDQSPIVTTNFRPFEAVILHMVTRVKPDGGLDQLVADSAPDSEIAGFLRIVGQGIAQELCPLRDGFRIDENAGPDPFHEIVGGENFRRSVHQRRA